MNKFLLAGMAAATVLASAPASAVDFTFAFTSSGGDVASGRMSTTKSGRYYIINAIRGTINGNAITGLSDYASADQKMKVGIVPHSTSHFTLYGVSFADDHGTQYNLNNYPTFVDDFLISSANGSSDAPQSYDVAFSVAAVPEPAVWGMMIAGFGTIGFAKRRRRLVARSI
jgi:opacity protein-like surface antigen